MIDKIEAFKASILLFRETFAFIVLLEAFLGMNALWNIPGKAWDKTGKREIQERALEKTENG